MILIRSKIYNNIILGKLYVSHLLDLSNIDLFIRYTIHQRALLNVTG